MDTDTLPDPDVIAEEITEDLPSVFEQIESVLTDLPELRREETGR